MPRTTTSFRLEDSLRPRLAAMADAVRHTTGLEADRVAASAAALGLHERQVVIALNYAAANRPEIESWIAANERALDEAARVSGERKRLIA